MITYYFNNLSNKTSGEMGKALKPAKNIIKEASTELHDKLIVKISDKIKEFENLVDSNEYFSNLTKENPEFKSLGNNTYQYQDYFINIGKRFKLTPHSVNLQDLREFKLSSAPEIIAYSDLKNNTDCILITKIKGCQKSVPQEYREYQSEVTLEAKNKLLEDVELLAQHNIAVDNILNKNNWYVVPETGDIIISNWSDCMPYGSESAKAVFKNKLRELLGLVY